MLTYSSASHGGPDLSAPHPGKSADADPVAHRTAGARGVDAGKRDLFLESDRPTLRARRGKGNGARAVPLHPKLRTALIAATSYGAMGPGRLIESYRTTAWGRVQSAVELAEERAQLATGRHVGTHTLRHSYTRNLLKNGTPLNYPSRWLESWPGTPILPGLSFFYRLSM